MITVSISPIIFSIGHFHLRWYSLIVITAIVVGVWLTAREAGRKGFKKRRHLRRCNLGGARRAVGRAGLSCH